MTTVIDKLNRFAKSAQGFAHGLINGSHNSNRRKPVVVLFQNAFFSFLFSFQFFYDEVMIETMTFGFLTEMTFSLGLLYERV